MRQKKRLLLLACLEIGFALRISFLSFQPLWGDEGWSFYFASYGWADLIALTAADIHPPLYYLLLKAWLMVIGTQAESARLFSAFVGTLLIPLMYRLARYYGSARLGLITAALTMLMPMGVYYAQEVRMYGLVTVFGLISMLSFGSLITTRHTHYRPVLAYILSTTAALYTMYYAVFLLFSQLLIGLGLSLARPTHLKNTLTRRLVMSGLAVAGLYLPWLIYATPCLLNYIQHKRAVEGYLPLTLWHFFHDHLIAFTLGHVPQLLAPYAPYVTLIFMVIAAIGAIARQKPPLSLLLAAYSIIPLLCGYLINQRFPFTPPTYERTLFLAAPAYWLLISLGLETLWRYAPRLTKTLSVVLGLILALHLEGFYVLPRYTAADYRPMLAEIAARATPEDTLLASYQWQYGFYQAYLPAPRPHIFIVPQWGEGWDADATGQRPRLAADLNTLLTQSPRLWFPAHQIAGHIWEDAAEAQLAELGFPARLTWYNPQTKLTLVAGNALPSGATAEGQAHFTDALTVHYRNDKAPAYQAGRDIIPVQLTWQKKGHLEQPYQVNLRLVDEAGRTWASRDSDPRAGQRPFSQMAVGETLADRHGLLVEAGTPPGQYRLLLSVRRVGDAHPLDVWNEQQQAVGAEVAITTVEVIDPQPLVGAAALPAAVLTEANFGDMVDLVGYTLTARTVKAGDIMPMQLFWQALQDISAPLTLEVMFTKTVLNNTITLTQPVFRPNWHKGTLLTDPHDVVLPANMPPGSYLIGLSMRQANTLLPIKGETIFPLTFITVTTRPRLNDEPPMQIRLKPINFNDQAEWVGLDLPKQTVRLGQTLPFTLYWHALKPFDRNWKIFAHLVDEQGNVVAQQDQIPGGGQFPTLGWLPPEYITDSYAIAIPSTAKTGPVWLRLGFYDAHDFSRLPVLQNGQIIADNFRLEGWPIRIEE